MPCNLAVTITKTVVAAEHLHQLLTPEAVTPVVLAYVRERLPTSSPTATVQGATVLIWAGAYTITITGAEIQVSGDFADLAEQLAEEITQVLAVLADELFAAELSALLAPFGATTQQVMVDNAGVQQTAYQFTFTL
jgi:hypothetical protein